MGFLFGKKKVVPKVPLPEGRMSSDALRFPLGMPRDRVIEPERMAGAKLPWEQPAEKPGPLAWKPPRQPKLPEMPLPPSRSEEGPFYVKVDVYQNILGEVKAIRGVIAGVTITNRQLERSEHREENHFEKLRKNGKVIHDRLLQVDKILFKGE